MPIVGTPPAVYITDFNATTFSTTVKRNAMHSGEEEATVQQLAVNILKNRGLQMTSTSNIILNGTSDQTDFEKITALLERLTDEDLAGIRTKVIEEIKRRVSKAEETVASRKKIFGLLNSQSTSQKSRQRIPGEPAKARIPKKNKAKAVPKGMRSPHGKIKEVLLDFLKDEPKGRKQIMVHISGLGLPTNSIGTLLSRLKKEQVIAQDAKNEPYSLVSSAIEKLDDA